MYPQYWGFAPARDQRTLYPSCNGLAGSRLGDHLIKGIVKLSRIRLTGPQDDGLESRREPGMLGVDHRDSA